MQNVPWISNATFRIPHRCQHLCPVWSDSKKVWYFFSVYSTFLNGVEMRRKFCQFHKTSLRAPTFRPDDPDFVVLLPYAEPTRHTKYRIKISSANENALFIHDRDWTIWYWHFRYQISPRFGIGPANTKSRRSDTKSHLRVLQYSHPVGKTNKLISPPTTTLTMTKCHFPSDTNTLWQSHS